MAATGGGGSRQRHKLTITQVKFRRKPSGMLGVSNLNKSFNPPSSITRSRSAGPSPMMFPRAHTACSQTFGCGDDNNLRNNGTAPECTTAIVCADVPEAMFVKAHAASNCKFGLKLKDRITTQQKTKHNTDFTWERPILFANLSVEIKLRWVVITKAMLWPPYESEMTYYRWKHVSSSPISQWYPNFDTQLRKINLQLWHPLGFIEIRSQRLANLFRSATSSASEYELEARFYSTSANGPLGT